jgi:predicted ATPase with chaperone activity
MTIEEAFDVTHVYSVADQLASGVPPMRSLPFRAPHHTVSHAGLVGGDTYGMKDYCLALHPYSAGGAYVNFLMDEGKERVRATYREN